MKQAKEEMRINLQLFAEAGEGGTSGEGQEAEKVSMTQEEFDKKLQSETDKRVTQALKTAQEKWEADFTAKLEAEKKEAERLAKLSADEKQKELLEKTRKDIESREKALRQKELKLDTIDLLSEKKLPVKFADFVMGEDAESTMERIKAFEEQWQSALEAAVNEKLKGSTPTAGGKAKEKNPWSKEHFNLSEQGRIITTNPELAKQMMAEARK